MRYLNLILFFLLFFKLSGQTIDSLGIDNNSILNNQEVNFFNKMLVDTRNNLDFKSKKIAFVTGSSGHTILNKIDYFKQCIKPWTSKGRTPNIGMQVLSAKEKTDSGGFDVIIISWTKIFTAKQKAKTIKELNKRN